MKQEDNIELIQTAKKNIIDILADSIKFNKKENSALIVFDTQNELTEILTEAYRLALPEAKFLNFDETENSKIIDEFNLLSPKDLVVLIQTGSFRLDEFRIRIHLYNHNLKVIEHLHLYRNTKPTWPVYINSLEYDKEWYHVMGKSIQTKLSKTEHLQIVSSSKVSNLNIKPNAEEKEGSSTSILNVTSGLEIPKLNTGDYTGMQNIGGTFPIGEVFTEGKILEKMNGSFWVYAFADSNFEIIMPDPFRIDILDGLVCTWSKNAPDEFVTVIENIKAYERPIVREIGFGLNRAISKELVLGDITAFERIVGLHLSLGEKHSVYKKEGIITHKSRFHVDLFVQTKQIIADGEVIFEEGIYKNLQ